MVKAEIKSETMSNFQFFKIVKKVFFCLLHNRPKSLESLESHTIWQCLDSADLTEEFWDDSSCHLWQILRLSQTATGKMLSFNVFMSKHCCISIAKHKVTYILHLLVQTVFPLPEVVHLEWSFVTIQTGKYWRLTGWFIKGQIQWRPACAIITMSHTFKAWPLMAKTHSEQGICHRMTSSESWNNLYRQKVECSLGYTCIETSHSLSWHHSDVSNHSLSLFSPPLQGKLEEQVECCRYFLQGCE